MTDTHSHVYMPDAFDDGGVGAVETAIAAGVSRLVLPCVDMNSLAPMKELKDKFPENVRLGLGLHPTELSPDWEKVLDEMECMLPGDFSAIGEVGIDLYHDTSMRAEQNTAFRRQLEWGLRHGLPVIIHCREGLDDTLDAIDYVKNKNGGLLPELIFHSFTGAVEDVSRIREVCDPWFGINGVVTFKNAANLRKALPMIGIDRILLETDSPWLAPVPKRGRRNESANIPYIRDCVAATLRESGLDITREAVEAVTDASASRLFSF